jgi:hypothetical protein
MPQHQIAQTAEQSAHLSGSVAMVNMPIPITTSFTGSTYGASPALSREHIPKRFQGKSEPRVELGFPVTIFHVIAMVLVPLLAISAKFVGVFYRVLPVSVCCLFLVSVVVFSAYGSPLRKLLFGVNSFTWGWH